MSQTTGAPGRVETLRAFINTRDVEAGTDLFGSTDEAATWLRQHDLLVGDGRLTDDDLARLTGLREALRAMTLENAGHDRGHGAELEVNRLARPAQLVVELDGGRPMLVPAGTGVDGAIAVMMAILHEAVMSGEWQRLKACGNDTCQWAYYDRSRNGSRRWCDSQGCGNLMAARAYRRRQRASRTEDA